MSENFISVIEPGPLNSWKGGQHAASVFRHKLAMFLTGFIMLTPHRIAILCAPYILKRFHLPPATVPLFIYKIHNPMELASLIGTVLQLVITATITLICNQTEPPGLFGVNNKIGAYDYANGSWKDPDTATEDTSITQLKALFSIIFAWIMFSSSIITYIFFVTGDDYGCFNKFFWSVIFNAFANGLYSSISFSVNTNAAIYAVGLPLSGAFTFIFNKICRSIHERWDWDDYDYTRVQLQIIFTILILFITAGWWTFDQVCQITGTNGKAKGTGSGNIPVAATLPGSSDIDELFDTNDYQGIRHWSPILMLGSSLGSVYAFYPAITPYMLMDIDVANDLDQWIQFISSIPTLVIGFLDEFDVGPGGISAGNWGKFENGDGVDVKEVMRRELQNLHNHMNGKTYTENGKTINYDDGAFKTKVDNARKKVDHTVTNPSPVRNANDLKDALKSSGAIKLVVKYWDRYITQINSQHKNQAVNKPAKDAIEEIKKYTNPALPAHDTIGNHASASKARPQAGNWNTGGKGRKWWHPIGWGPFVPYILCIHIFITMLHYPDGLVATFLHNRPRILKCICISFNFWQEIMEIIGFAGAGKQSNKSGYAMVYNSSVGTFNNFFFFFVMINCMFTGDLKQTLLKLSTLYNCNMRQLWIIYTISP